MKIVIQSINFHPELTGIGKYAGEMARWLTSKGHEVRVITAPPYYPKWKISPGYKKYFWSSEVWCGVKVYRCPVWVPLKPNGLTRIFHLASFSLSSLPIMLWQIFWRSNIIFTIEPPLFAAPAALVASRISGARSILHIQDFEVDAAFDLGLLKGVRLKKLVLGIEKFILRRFDLVCTISGRMVERVISKGLVAENIFLFPNWVDARTEFKTSHQDYVIKATPEFSYRKHLNLPPDGVIAMYSGNMGAKQGLEILGQVARKFQYADENLPLVHFVFCGDGIGREKLIEQCKGLNFVHFLDLQPAENLACFLAMADIHLLPQRADASDLVMPSKLTGMMASARPILASAHNGTELANVVQCCGLVVPPENPQSFYDALLSLISDKDLRNRLGVSGFKYAINNLDRDRILLSFESKLKTIIS
ncbi:glycosyltransferase WbuB [Polynucleobacter sp. es-MAR-4]|uniref:glycosyltransferase WbuB n=1 Tax=Polynucleobacter sp. es-MAR-4 TaxID=1855655 RepID=UPI001C0D5BF4|nr:glycosyltransferase WbuB [Polynucleobacter sp. es-MAR-4]MBU3637556.1 glycosyltransferase WbuB [Polynucleobacter sp. es-MAR-4]